jgi:hypothetical protein
MPKNEISLHTEATIHSIIIIHLQGHTVTTQKTINWTPPSKASNFINKHSLKIRNADAVLSCFHTKNLVQLFTSFHFMFQQFYATSPKLLHWYSASRLINLLWIWNMKFLRLPIRLEAIALTIVVYRCLFPLSTSGLQLWLTTRFLFIRVWKASQYTSNPRMVWGLIFTLYVYKHTHTHECTNIYQLFANFLSFFTIKTVIHRQHCCLTKNVGFGTVLWIIFAETNFPHTFYIS